MERIIGTYHGKQPGPMLIAIGGMHGNEVAGVKAIETLLQMLENEPNKNPNFEFNGTFLGLIGNLRAYQQKQRFIKKDLNRQWATEHIEQVFKQDFQTLDAEDIELKELLSTVLEAIKSIAPTEILLLDLHTTSAEGGIFSIVTEDAKSQNLAQYLHAPVITGLLKGLSGTTLHYFNTKNFDIPTAAVAFESGQHDDPLSVNRAIAALIYALKALGCVAEKDIESQHELILKQYAEGLPKIAQLRYSHHIKPEDAFQMMPGYQNFQQLQAGEVIAKDIAGEIKAPYDCQILMPLYQKQGTDGFFLIEPIAN
jgi:succinylglutamate desuccinylase